MIPKPPNNVAVVVDATGLQTLIERLRRGSWVAVDTEFLRERTYFPKLCLVQLASADEVACVDPLALEDLSALSELLADESVTKVFHAAFQDMEILYQVLGTVPRPVFDTQIGAALLGYPDQIGYAALAEAMLGVSVDKSHTRADWSRRPLSDQELAYAADDVRYLAQLYPQMIERLEVRGRLSWLADEFTPLSDPARYESHPAQAWRRIKAAHKLKPAQQQALAELAEWREATAIATDRPRGWIVKDDTLVDLARRRPRDQAELQRIRGLPEKTVAKHGEAILACIEKAAEKPAEALAAEQPRLDSEQAALVDMLMTGLRIVAAEADISPTALASRRELEKLVRGEQDLPILKGWRRAAGGETLLALLHGERCLRSAGGTPRIE